MASIPNAFRQQTLEYWQGRVKTARLKYDQAVAQSRKALEQQQHRGLSAPDVSAAVRNARRAQDWDPDRSRR